MATVVTMMVKVFTNAEEATLSFAAEFRVVVGVRAVLVSAKALLSDVLVNTSETSLAIAEVSKAEAELSLSSLSSFSHKRRSDSNSVH